MRSAVETTDIFRGAFFLCKGGDLCGIRIRDNGRRIATFLIRGEGLRELDRAYRRGRALVNPLELRESLNHLRDVLFEKLREEDPTSRERYVAAKGRTRYDRKGENRGDQTGR